MGKGKNICGQEKAKSKTKLRTAGEVINRLKFDGDCDSSNVMIGYDDRVNGPMEKALYDFIPISQGGDIPEHRIWYFRREPTMSSDNYNDDDSTEDDERVTDLSRRLSNAEIQDLVLWDRPGRVDKLFGASGESCKIVSEETTMNVRAAVQNMVRIEAEKLERRKLRDKERQRRAQKRHARNEAIALLGLQRNSNNRSPCENEQDQRLQEEHSSSLERYTWHDTQSYDFNDGQWVSSLSQNTSDQEWDQKQYLKIVSWNVLFDMHDTTDGDLPQKVNHSARWTTIIEELCESDGDIIGLQEITPVFIDILATSQKIQNEYAMTAAPGRSNTITPCGNLILWRKQMFQPISSWICRDGTKQRSGLVALKWTSQNKIILLANIHLLADPPAQKSAAQARQRELSSVIAQLQFLESKIHKIQREKDICPVIVGDFNANEQQREFEEGCFSGEALVGNQKSNGFFLDAWLQVSSAADGYTFNPQTNPKAHFTRKLTTKDCMSPKRNDRVYVAEQGSLMPSTGELLGNRGDKSPSDHFGVSLTLLSTKRCPTSKALTLHDPLRLRNAWAASVEPTNDTLLGLVLSETTMGGINFYDPDSTLPLPHITVLHGFAEYNSRLGVNHLIEAVSDAVDVFLRERGDSDSFNLSFSPSCLDVFQHKSSSTLVALPDVSQSSWLLHLYRCLMATFPKCHHQETRFESGWTPHVSLGSFGTSNAARSKLTDIMEGTHWISTKYQINVGSITLFERSKIDGKIHAVSSIPLMRKISDGRKMTKPSIFLNDMGLSWSRYFQDQSEGPILEIQRLCQQTADDLRYGLVQVVPTGSYALGVCLPHLSDIDVVVKIQKNDDTLNVSGDAFFQRLTTILKGTHKFSKARGRTAGTATSSVSILTIRISPWSPAIDLILCFVGQSNQPIDPHSEIAQNTIFDTSDILMAFCAQTRKVFQSVLRTIKLWAWREGVYGQALGYLGGGGWGVLVARVLSDGYQKGDLKVPLTETSFDLCKASRTAVEYFFKHCSESQLLRVTLGARPLLEAGQNEAERARLRGVMAVFAPRSQGNHGRNATPSTTCSTLEALSRASATTLENLFSTSHVTIDSVKTHRFAIRTTVEASAESGKLAEAKAFLYSRTLRLVVDLERQIPCLSRQMRLFSSPDRKVIDSVVSISLFIGFNLQPTKDFEITLKRAQVEWNQDLLHMGISHKMNVSWIRSTEL